MQAQLSILKRGQEDTSLLEHLQRIANHSDRGWALHIHMSKLGPRSRSQNLVFALEMLRGLVANYSGRVFALKNSDIVCLMTDTRIAEIKANVRRIEMLFHDDPLFHLEADTSSNFCTFYDLKDKFGPFLSEIEAIIRSPSTRAPAPAMSERPAAEASESGSLTWFASAIDRLAAVRPWPFMSHQPICLIAEGKPVTPVLEEVYTSIPDLDRFLGSGASLMSERWLFQHATKLFDRRTLESLTRPANSAAPADPSVVRLRDRLLAAGNFSINLNVASVLSPEFRAFDSGIDPSARGTIVLEFHRVDVFADLGSFLYIRDQARKLGYRICLDGLSHLSLPFIDRTDLGVDLMKVYWTGEMSDDRARLRQMVECAGEQGVILCRCDSEQAIEYGMSVGISLFQGKQVDTMMGGQSKAPSFLWSFSAPIAVHH